jgi:hypothetical protein
MSRQAIAEVYDDADPSCCPWWNTGLKAESSPICSYFPPELDNGTVDRVIGIKFNLYNLLF